MQEVSAIVEHDLGDPRLRGATFTSARISPDLRHARIMFSCMGDKKTRNHLREALVHAGAYIRRELTRRLSLRFSPTLTFELDDSLERAERIDKLLWADGLRGSRRSKD